MNVKQSILDPTIRALKKFFWFCGGADISILDRAECSTEHNKYAGIGSTVLLTAVLASISGGYAMFTVFRRYPQTIAFGILWGVLIFNLDRYIVLSMRAERAGNRRRILTALPRLVLALLISIVVTVPLELKIFDREIKEALITINNAKFAEKQKQADDIYNSNDSIKTRAAEIDRLRREINEAEETYRDLENQATLEANGKGGSGHRGMREQYTRLQGLADAARIAWETKQRALENRQAEYDNDPEVKRLRDQKVSSLKEARNATQENTGILARLNALHGLMLSQRSTLVAFCLLALLFLTLETAPVVVKLLSARGPYDAFLEAKEAEVVAREERRTADAAAKADQDAEMDASIRKKEYDKVQATLTAVSSDPSRVGEITQVLDERLIKRVIGVLPPDDPRFERERESIRDYKKSHDRWRKLVPIAIGVLAVLGCLVLLWRFLPRPGQSSDLPEAYVWKDPTKDNSYLAVLGPSDFDPARLFPEKTDLRFQLTDVKAPLAAPGSGSGVHMAVYTIAKHITSRHSLTDPSGVTMVHLFGEKHLGRSQLEEAALICKMLREQEIDAIFLEQPDNLHFDWSQFEQLKANPGQAIAALQYQMQSDAESVPDMRLGRYDPYFRKGDITTPGGLAAIEDKIREVYGDDAVDDFRTRANEQLRAEETSPGGRAYANSEYISAADYLYVMTNLRNMGIPFHNVDKEGLRDSYEPDGGLDQREEFAAQQIAKISRENGYRNVIYICGAFHLTGVAAAIRAAKLDSQPAKLQPKEEMNFLHVAIKEKIAALIHPEVVVARASREPPSGFGSGDSKLVLTGAPSDQLVDQFTKQLRTEMDGALDEADISAFSAHFIKRYAEEELRGRDKWSLTLVNTAGNKALVVSWDKRAGRELEIVYERAFTDLQTLTSGKEPVHELPYKDHLLAKETNQATKTYVLTAVSKNLSHYSFTLGNVFRKDLTAEELMSEVNHWLRENPRKVIFLSASDFPGENDFEAFAHTCQALQGQIDPLLSVVAFNAAFDANRADASQLFSKKLRLERIEPDIETIGVGIYKGWFAVTLRFLDETLTRLTVKVIVKSYELALALFRNLNVITATTNDTPESFAEIVTRAIRQSPGAKPSDEKIRLQILKEWAVLERAVDGGRNA